jgi:DNA-binding transcriptional MerR regulator
MRIGEFAQRTGTSQRALRYYEEQGLLQPLRQTSGYRQYAPTDVRVVRRIRMLLAAGLNTTTIADLLPCMGEDDEELVPACPELAAVLTQHRDRINADIDNLTGARDALEAIIATADSQPDLQATPA